MGGLLSRWKRNRPPKRGVVLDVFTVESLRKDPAKYRALLLYEWQLFIELETQRRARSDEIQQALHDATQRDLVVDDWQRAVHFKWSLSALSCVGSMKADAGGRFNFGSMQPNRFQPFPALYVAEDRDTAVQELLCQENKGSGLSNFEFALQKPDSITTVHLGLHLERYLDLRNAKAFEPLMTILSSFTVTDEVLNAAAELRLKGPSVIGSAQGLIESLLEKEWRRRPMIFDLPANCQIFGEMAQAAGVNGIVYTSKMSGKLAIAAFPRTFRDTQSFIEVRGDAPAEMKLRRIDSTTHGQCE